MLIQEILSTYTQTITIIIVLLMSSSEIRETRARLIKCFSDTRRGSNTNINKEISKSVSSKPTCLDRIGIKKSFSFSSNSPRTPSQRIPSGGDIQVESSGLVRPPTPFLDHQVEQLLAWKNQPGITYLTERLEIQVSSIVMSIQKWEGRLLSSQELNNLIDVIIKTPHALRSRNFSQVAQQARTFIQDVYVGFFSSSSSSSKVTAFYINEFKIFEHSQRVPGWEKNADDLLEYLSILKSKVSRYYEQYETNLNEWKAQMKVIIEKIEKIHEKGYRMPSIIAGEGYMYQEILQIKKRSGDPSILQSILERVHQKDDILISFDQFLEPWLAKIHGIRSLNFDKSHIPSATRVIYDDLNALPI